MPDITMCVNKQCPLRSKCYRYRAVPDGWQSFAKFEPSNKAFGGYGDTVLDCDYFWEIEGRVLLSTEEADGRYIPNEPE